MVTFLLVCSLGLAEYAAPQDQASKPNTEQQLKSQYQLTRVGANGVVLQAGSVLVVQQDNINAESHSAVQGEAAEAKDFAPSAELKPHQ